MSVTNTDSNNSVDILNDNVKSSEQTTTTATTDTISTTMEKQNIEHSLAGQADSVNRETTVDDNENIREGTTVTDILEVERTHSLTDDKLEENLMVSESVGNITQEIQKTNTEDNMKTQKVCECDEIRGNESQIEKDISTTSDKDIIMENNKLDEAGLSTIIMETEILINNDEILNKSKVQESGAESITENKNAECENQMDVNVEKESKATGNENAKKRILQKVIEDAEENSSNEIEKGKLDNSDKSGSSPSHDPNETNEEAGNCLYEIARTEEIMSLTAEQPNELTQYKLRASEGISANEDEDEDEECCEFTPTEGYIGSFKKPQNILESIQDTELVKAIRCAAIITDAETIEIDPEITEILDKVDNKKSSDKQPTTDEVIISSRIERSSLGLLASQYDSDTNGSDEGSVEITDPKDTRDQYRAITVDSGTSSSSESDVEIVSQTSEVQKIIDVDILDDDEDDNPKKSRIPIRAKGEMTLDDLPPIQDLKITVPEYECVELGKIQSIIDQLVLVESIPGTVPLNLDTVLFLEKGQKVLGEVFDVLGQVSNPLYCVRFNSNEHIKEKGIELGQTVYVAPRSEHTQFVILPELLRIRGSDASWEHDIEPSEKYLDYSDDEEERKAKQLQRSKNRQNDEPESTKKQRVTPGANRSGRSQQSCRDQQFQQCTTPRYNHPSPQYQQPTPQYQHPSPQQPQFQQNNFGQYNYNSASSSWHSSYNNQQSTFYPNPYARPPFIPPDAMQQVLFPPPPPPNQ